MQFFTTPLGGDGRASTNVFGSPVSQAAAVGAGASTQRIGQGQGPHKVLSEAIGSAFAGLVSSVDLSRGDQVAKVIQEHIANMTNSVDGTAAGVQPVNGPVNGQANIQEGIAIISGQKAGH